MVIKSNLIYSKDKKINWEEYKIPNDLLNLIPLESIKKYRFLPFYQDKKFIDVAVVDTDIEDANVKNALKFFVGKIKKKARVYSVTEDDFNIVLKKFKNPEIEINKALKNLEANKEEEDKKTLNLKRKKEEVVVMHEAPVAKMVEVILKNAIDGKASDIHIEPLEENIRIRYRVDGVLYSSLLLPSKVGPAIVSRIKILSNLKIDEKRKPQDGRFRINDLGRTIDFRVSSFPVSHGEKIVMRILDKNEGLINLKNLGLREQDAEVIKRVIKEPFGIILVTGPTGSGKSTTLYSILKILNKEGVNVVTLEDPVEYMIDGVSQSQVRPAIDYTFASGLRSILRQDPDVIMVGEIRDSETAELAIHAALTGHLVLSTLHTNTAIGAIPRLVDMGIQPFLLSSALKIVIGQRLVRQICSECKTEKKEVAPGVIKMINSELEKTPQNILKELKLDQSVKPNLYYGKGCNRCFKTGMKGRVGIYEILEIDNTISKLIGKQARESEIVLAAKENDFTTMKQDGIIKALLGATTIEEIQRVTEDDNEEEVIVAKGE